MYMHYHSTSIIIYIQHKLEKCLNSHSCHFVKNIFNQNSFKHMFNGCTLRKKSIGLLD